MQADSDPLHAYPLVSHHLINAVAVFRRWQLYVVQGWSSAFCKSGYLAIACFGLESFIIRWPVQLLGTASRQLKSNPRRLFGVVQPRA